MDFDVDLLFSQLSKQPTATARNQTRVRNCDYANSEATEFNERTEEKE